MASRKPGQSSSEQAFEEFLARRPSAAESAAAVTDLRDKVRQYEERYNLPSIASTRRSRQGELAETLDVCDWMIHYDILQYVEGR